MFSLFVVVNISSLETPSFVNWAPSSEFVSSSIPSWQISTAHAQPFRGARTLAFCLKVPLDSLLVWASSEGSGETARMRRLAWIFAARIGDKYQIRLTRSNYQFQLAVPFWLNWPKLIMFNYCCQASDCRGIRSDWRSFNGRYFHTRKSTPRAAANSVAIQGDWRAMVMEVAAV